MKKGKILWTPYPYKAGFCITDDTDAADFESIKLVYDFLKEINFPVTKNAWAFSPKEPCGIPATPASTLRGVTLEDNNYFAYCKDLYNKGFEICLHGASAGNNTREYTIQAINLFKEHFGNPDTFICHSKNADNLYWEEKVISNKILRKVLSLYSRHECSGEITTGKYFWGDICRENINQIRLFRTRSTNTLSVNPSMPYFDKKKPYVRGWFSATKRSFVDCTTEKALRFLKHANGLTVLYQYLHRYADTEAKNVDKKFKTAALKFVEDTAILKDTVTNIMKRLRLIHGIFLVYRKNFFWLINTNNETVKNFQITIPKGYRCCSTEKNISQINACIVISEIEQNSFIKIMLDRPLAFSGKNVKKLNSMLTAIIPFRFGRVYLNFSDKDHALKSVSILKNSFKIFFREDVADFKPMSKAATLEVFRLFFGQVLIIFREILFKGRSLDSNKFLGAKEIRLENHDNW